MQTKDVPMSPAPVSLYILTGQSNAQGCILDGEPLVVPPDDADREILFYWTTRSGDGDSFLSTSGGRIGRLQAQMFDSGVPDGNWGLEFGCFRALHRAGFGPLLLVKATRGGGGNALWWKDSPNPQMYNAVVDAVRGALRELDAAGRPYRFRGLLYLQGECDGDSAPLAGERARLLLDNLRAAFPHASAMRLYLGGIAGFGPARDRVRQEHRALAGRDPDVDFIDTHDLLLTHQYRDRLHVNNAAKAIIGERFAAAIRAAETR